MDNITDHVAHASSSENDLSGKPMFDEVAALEQTEALRASSRPLTSYADDLIAMARWQHAQMSAQVQASLEERKAVVASLEACRKECDTLRDERERLRKQLAAIALHIKSPDAGSDPWFTYLEGLLK